MRDRGARGRRLRLPAALLACAVACLALPAAASAATQTFGFTGGPQSFIMPAGVNQVTIEACGAEGGDGTVGGPGGEGGCVTASIGGLTPGETLAVFVGGQGGNGQGGVLTPSIGGAGGFNGGATGGASPPNLQAGGGGGGASDVRRGGSDLDDRVVVGGGGGGGGSGGGTAFNAGGAGGGTTGGTGGNGAGALGGGGGDQNDGGDGGTGGPDPDGAAGQLGLGGTGANGTCCGGGGGGGGYYGGGGGEGGQVIAAGGGGGGSSFPVAATHQQGMQAGNGRVSITFDRAAPALTTAASADVELGGSVQDVATLAGGFNPSGEITFRLFGPDDGNCSGTPVFTDTVAVSGNGEFTSGAFTPTRPGTYRWVASYSGDADNHATANACDEASERVRVLAPPNEPPRIANLRLVPDEFFALGRRTPLKGGTSIRFTLSEAATVHFRVRRDPPRRRGGPPPKHSHRFTRTLEAGSHRVSFTGTLDGRTFKPRDYLMFARAVDPGGLSSADESAPFTILGG